MKRNIGITRNFYRKLEKTETAYKEKIHQQFRCLEEEGESYPGLNYEKLLAQDEWYSIRLNKSDRAICKVNQDLIGKNYIFHNFGPHNVEEKIKIKEQPVFKEGISDIFEGIIEN